MFKLDKYLKDWVQNKLITQQQAQAISQHERAKPESYWILSGLLLLGVVTLGLGAISLVAANWQEISNTIKLTADFILLLGLSVAIIFLNTTQNVRYYNSLIVCFVFLCLASIGLISQIYQLSGEFYQALLFWALITFGITLTTTNIVVWFMWGMGFLIGLFFTTINSVYYHEIFYENYQAILMGVSLMCFCIVLLGNFFNLAKGIMKAWFLLTFIIFLFSLIAGESHHFNATSNSLVPYIVGYIFAVLAILLIYFNHEFTLSQKILCSSTIIFFLIVFHLPILNIKIDLIYALLTLAILSSLAMVMASLKQKYVFQFFLLLIELRILILYFQALGGLAMTGLGLVGSGLLIIIMSLLWNKYGSTIAVQAERWVHDQK